MFYPTMSTAHNVPVVYTLCAVDIVYIPGQSMNVIHIVPIETEFEAILTGQCIEKR